MRSPKIARPSSSRSAREERRGGAERRGAFGRLRALLGRPLRLERRGGQLHVTLVDCRQPSPLDPAVALERMRGELRDRLLAHQHAHAAQVMRHLVFVHHELGGKGWAGVSSFPARMLRKALVQAEILATEEPSPAMAEVVDRLRACKVAAELREERASTGVAASRHEQPEVTEATHEEFAQMQLGWVDTVSSVLVVNAGGR